MHDAPTDGLDDTIADAAPPPARPSPARRIQAAALAQLDRAAAGIARRVGSLLPLLLTLSASQGLLWAWLEFGSAGRRIAPAHALTMLGASLYRPDHDLPIYLCGALACVLADAAFVALLARPAWRADAATGARADLLACIAVALLPALAPVLLPLLMPLLPPVLMPDETSAWLLACVLGLAWVANRVRVRARSTGMATEPPAAAAPAQDTARPAGLLRDCALPVAILALLVFVPWPRQLLWWSFDTDRLHHLDFYVMAPALAHAHGLRLGTDFYAQYGVGWPLLLDALGAATGARGYTAFIWLEILAGCAYFLGVFVFLRSWLRHAGWATVGLLLALALALFTDTGHAPKWIWPSSTVLRYMFDIALFAILAAHAQRGDARLGPLAGAVLGLQALFSIDVGLYLSLAFCIYLVCAARCDESQRPPGSILRFALGAAAGWLLVAGAGFTWANQGRWPDAAFWRGLTESLVVYGGGIANLPIALAIVGNGALALLLLAMLATYFRSAGAALSACWTRSVSARQAVRAAIAVHGLGTLMIFIGRSHEQNLMHVTIPWCLLLADSAVLALRELPPRAGTPRIGWTFALAAALTVFIAAQAAAMRYPNLIDGAAGLLDTPSTRRPSWTDAAGDALPATPASRLAEFRAASDAIRAASGGGRHSVAVLGFNDTEYLLEAGVAPYFRSSPVLANLLFKDQVEGVTRRLAEAPPDWVFLSNDTRAFVGNASLTDSTGAIRAAIQPGYDLLGDVGQFTVYRKKDFRP